MRRLTRLGCLLLVLFGGCFPSALAWATDDRPPPAIVAFRLPWATESLAAASLLKGAVARLPAAEGLVVQRLLAGLPAWLGRAELAKLGTLTQDAVTAEALVAEGMVEVRLDRQRLASRSAPSRHAFGQFLADLLPVAAQQAETRFGVVVHRADGEPRPLAEAVPGERLVLLVHGLDDPGDLWDDMIAALNEAGYLVGVLTYANDQAIDASAAFLADRMRALRQRGVTRVDLVAHSMGGLVSREVLTSPAYYGGDGQGDEHYPTVSLLVMCGTPNSGSEMARLRLGAELYEQLSRLRRGQGGILQALFDGNGEASRDLLPGSAFLRRLNARPLPKQVHLTIVAGHLSPVGEAERQQLMALLPKDMPGIAEAMACLTDGLGDGAVTLTSSRLAGVDDYHAVAATHIGLISRSWPGQPLPPAVPIVLRKLAEQ